MRLSRIRNAMGKTAMSVRMALAKLSAAAAGGALIGGGAQLKPGEVSLAHRAGQVPQRCGLDAPRNRPAN